MIKKTASMLLLALALTAADANAVTLNVTVPEGTKMCFVVGDFNGWAPSDGRQLTKVDNTIFTLTDESLTTEALCKGYKYVCGPDWKYVEKDASGGEISNRTSVSNPDVVAKWASLYSPNENIKETKLTLNGYERKVRVLLPEGYSASTDTYPVIYYVGLQKRYNNAGDDSDCGDDLFGSASWNLPDRLADLAAAQSIPAIFVATYSFVAENIPYPAADFVGSGASDAYLADLISVLKPYIDANYRTKTAPANTAVMGADFGGNLAIYATLKHSDVFGRCLAMSPMTWMVQNQLEAEAAAFNGNAVFCLTYGDAEPASVSGAVNALANSFSTSANVTVSAISGATHDDVAWGEAFPAFYAFAAAGAADAPAQVSIAPRRAPHTLADIASTTYYLFSKIASSEPASLDLDSDAAFTLVNNYRSGSSDVTAKVLVKVIPTDVKSKYYWNLSRDASGTDFLLSSVKNVSFSSKKSCDSWLRIVVKEDESVSNVAAGSKYFNVQGADGSFAMANTTGYKVAASNVTFNTTDKTFTIHYGSVNSGAEMGAISETLSVSANCTKADITYDFLTNQTTVTETDWGEILADDFVIEQFAAVPAVTTPGSNSRVAITINGSGAYSATLTSALNYATASDVTLTPAGANKWTADLSNLAAGIHTLSLSLTKGSATKSNVAEINIKVFDVSDAANETRLVANAYSGIDWAATEQYKANFHTHTSQSFDTKYRTDQVVTRYKDAGYKILALTDHDANSFPWDTFDVYTPQATAIDAEASGMLSFPGVELSKDNRNNWSEATGGEFNHHNDFFTGRVGQEFASLRESYAYTNAIGGMQIINHPGQYWNLSTTYTAGEKNSPQWHAENFLTYPSLIGLEVYNQGNRRPNDRILWDQILEITMPDRPVWGYSCDDAHTLEQYFRNYQHMLMPELTIDALKQAMRNGALYFSYEYTGSGNALAPTIEGISVDETSHTITIDTQATDIRWIYSTDRSGDASTRKSTVVGMGPTFDYTGFKGKYVRALITNDKGETCTQPFGFSRKTTTSVGAAFAAAPSAVLCPNPATDWVTVTSADAIESIEIHALNGAAMRRAEGTGNEMRLDVSTLPSGVYLVNVATARGAETLKMIKR